MIKYNVSNNVISDFNPIVSLKSNIRKIVNEKFILPILEEFFKNKGGIENFEALDVDKLRTDVEFNNKENEDESYVKTYIYKEIVQEIHKSKIGKIEFKPKFVITFDNDLTPTFDRHSFYPYEKIFNKDTLEKLSLKLNSRYDREIKNKGIYYGTLKIGKGVVLYHIGIELQRLIDFIKQIENNESISYDEVKFIESVKDKRNRLLDEIIRNKIKLLKDEPSDKLKNDIERLNKLKDDDLKGEEGILRINLAWNTTDDLDLHIQTPAGEISYNNKSVEYNDVIAALDIDANAGNNITSSPQENIIWDGLPGGKHKIFVHFYAKREKEEVPFILSIIPKYEKFGDGRVYDKQIKGKGTKLLIAEFEFVNDKLIIYDK